MNRRTGNITLVLVVIAVLVAGTLGAQEIPDETPVFVREMVQLMSEEGFTNADLAEFRQSCTAYQWEGLEEVDPQLLMRALRYSFAYGSEFEPGEQAQLAHELALQVQTMQRLGYEDRDIALVATTATRDIVRESTRSQNRDSDTGEMLRTRLQDSARSGMRDLDRDRTRDSDPEGPARRTGEDAPPMEPPRAPGTEPGTDPAGSGGDDRPGSDGDQPGPGAP